MPPRKKRMRQSALRPGAPPVAKKRYRWARAAEKLKVAYCYSAGITRRSESQKRLRPMSNAKSAASLLHTFLARTCLAGQGNSATRNAEPKDQAR